MLIAKEKFLDRVEQSFILLKNNFIALSVPFVIFNILTLVVIPLIGMQVMLHFIDIRELFSGTSQNWSYLITLSISIGFLGIIIYMLLLIPMQLGLILSIKQAILGKPLTPRDNILYGYMNILSVFRTYWYIFSYVFLIPALIFILGGSLMIFGMLSEGAFDSSIMVISYFIMGLGIILGAIFGIYRGIRSTFAIVSALHHESFTKSNFSQALIITKGKFWRMFWNIAGVGILGSLLIGLLSGIGNTIAFMGVDTSLSSLLMSNLEQEDSLQEIITSSTQFDIFIFINNVFQNTLGTILGVFISIFTYVFYLRLHEDFSGVHNSQVSQAQNPASLGIERGNEEL